jgi:hypothetical protein
MESNGGGGLGKLLPKGIRRRKRESREDMSASPGLAAATSDAGTNGTNGTSIDGDGNLDSTTRSMAKPGAGDETTMADGDDAGLASYESEGES